MPLPDLPAAPATSFAVLLLAWNEAAPAVRAVLEAVQAPDSTLPEVTVIVPAGLPAPASKLAAAPGPETAAVATPAPPAATPAATLPASASPTEVPRPEPAPWAKQPPAEATDAVAPASALLPATSFPGNELLLTSAKPVVHVLRLGSFSLPALAKRASQLLPVPVWTGPASVPAAPYLGATNEPTTNWAASFPIAGDKNLLVERPEQPKPPQATGLVLLAAASPAGQLALAGTLLPAVGEPRPLVSGYLGASPFFSSSAEEPDAPLDSDFAATSPAMPAFAAETETAEIPVADKLAPQVVPAESTTWPAALAALQTPAEVPGPAHAVATNPVGASHAVLRPPGPAPSTPNLNFQIIQYARFAVPVALAEQPFGVLYAPSWPTWLAAQELRQRTGHPLVLHLDELAAGTESADTATGWVAELQRQVLRRADLVLVETHALASRLRRELGLPAHAVRVVPAADTAGVARALRRVQA